MGSLSASSGTPEAANRPLPSTSTPCFSRQRAECLSAGRTSNADKISRRNVKWQVGLVFQYPEHQLFEETVYQDIAFGPRNMKLSDSEVDERVREAADFVGVDEKLFDGSPLELSGGQKRRVAIAGVIAMRPGVLILDEPTAGLDPAGCRQIMDNIRDYRERDRLDRHRRQPQHGRRRALHRAADSF